MKKLYTVLVLLPFVAKPIQTSAQTGAFNDPYIIEYDFATQNYGSAVGPDTRFDADKWVKFKFKHVNPFLFRIALLSKDSIMSVGTAPALLTSIANTENLGKLAANIIGLVVNTPAVAVVTSATVASNAMFMGSHSSGRTLTDEEIRIGDCKKNLGTESSRMQEAAKTYAKEITSLNAALARDLNRYSNVLLLKQKRRIELAGKIEGHFMGQSYVTDPTELDHIFGAQIGKAYGVNNTY